MKILPPKTLPWAFQIIRRHTPAVASGERGYRAYRPCLRWEFGFFCAFCLCHEADFTRYGRIEGWGLTQIEHFEPFSTNEDLRNDYENCFYICMFCNRARNDSPVLPAGGERLLNPCDEVWSDHFALEGDRLMPLPGDRDASYTAKAYDFNDENRMTMRRGRQVIEEKLFAYRVLPEKCGRLAEKAVRTKDVEILDAAEELWKRWKDIRADLELFRAIPIDAPETCRCGRTDHHTPPGGLDDQTPEL